MMIRTAADADDYGINDDDMSLNFSSQDKINNTTTLFLFFFLRMVPKIFFSP